MLPAADMDLDLRLRSTSRVAHEALLRSVDAPVSLRLKIMKALDMLHKIPLEDTEFCELQWPL
jgi:hypothetical protein